jgi:ribonucleotide monophosphatase NagD (HAD superfamily)
VLEKIDLGNFAEIINETHIVFIISNRDTTGPHTSENMYSRGASETLDGLR